MPDLQTQLFPLSDYELKLRYGAAVYQRAQPYLEQNKVFRLDIADDYSRIDAQVWGNSLIPYRQTIRLLRQGRDWQLQARCSCPVAVNCKHTLAVLLKVIQLQQQQHQQQQDKVQLWLNSLQQLEQQPVELEYKDRVLFLLDLTEQGLSVSPRRARRLKKGGFGQGSLLSEHDYRQGYIPHWGCSEDFRLLGLISSQNRFGQMLLKERWGALALQSMLQSGRCFWQKVQQEVKPGPGRQLQLSWQQQDEHHLLQLTLEGLPNWRLIDTTPPMYLDESRFEMGPIHTRLSGEQLQHLLNIPKVPEAELAQLWLGMQQALPTEQLPPPADIQIESIQQAPQAVLKLGMQQKGRRNLPVAELCFRYGPVELAAMAVDAPKLHHHCQGQQHFAIERQPEQEQVAIEQLQDTQLYPEHAHHSAVRYFSVVDDSPVAWLEWLERDKPWLQQQGWTIQQSADFDLGIIEADTEFEVHSDQPGWFQLDMHVQLGDERLPMLPLVQQWLQQHGEPEPDSILWLPLPDGRTLKLPANQLQPLFSTLQEFLQQGSDASSLRLPSYRSALLQQLPGEQLSFHQASDIRALSQKLQNFQGIENITVPAGLAAELRPYQQQGLNWLVFLQRYGFGGILADDMGLGKTLQTLAFLLQQKQQSRLQALVICPTSLIGNWQQEAERFTPELSVQVIHGQQRGKALQQLAEAELIITTYPLMARDLKYYQQHQFSHIVLDEAQQIKNSRSQTTAAIRKLQGHFRLCLSGTPLENHLGELKSLFDFALPGLLGSDAFFRKQFRRPIEREQHPQRGLELQQRVAPFLLRRTKSEVMSELPEKIEIDQYLAMETDQRQLYDSIRLSMESHIRQLFAEKGLAKSQIEFLDALLKLRQACCDARLVKLASAQKVQSSAKLDWLTQNVPEMIEEGRKIIIFSQFTSMLALIEEVMQQQAIPYAKLTGQTKKRQQQIDSFQQGEVPLFLISLKAGGTGLNLTAADTVIHYDPWWNPAVMQQATDRAHRIGQDKKVFVYKLIAKDTVEQKIQLLQQQKQALADSLFSGSQQGVWQGSADELLQLFS
ncbi:DEAD/DEAH box helicase [Alkalimonas mucilaginosa]|uniref:DEAD/DEAH box helicase n=1 Tax=Alkalimonas mucilaginosa TaxID=3057676 RepID=A0ABU7JFG4_9GAMM|nr:DEAD/DEAH box helicase [Alkalimonas sp. MEB004]MEE2024434.1 DEAD/DEAH box helicase [Alkalimonas sp. MEB004]